MAEFERVPPTGESGAKREPDDDDDGGETTEWETTEDQDAQAQSENELTLYRTCDDRTIKMNGMRKFSQDLSLERPVAVGEGEGRDETASY